MTIKTENDVIVIAKKMLEELGDTYGNVISVRRSEPKMMTQRLHGWLVCFEFDLKDNPPGAFADPAHFYVEVYDNGDAIVPPVM